MKKKLLLVVAMVMLVFAVCGCGKKEDVNTSSDKIKIVTTIFPEYDWVREILGDKADNAELTLLLDSGVDLHSYQPTTDDIVKISDCDIFIYVGGESDGWVEDVLKTANNKDMVAINLLDVLGDNVKEEELVEGMEGEEEEEEEGPEYDEHVWLSLKNAVILCNEIEKAIEKVDADNASTYQANVKAYTDSLSQLDDQYKSAVDDASTKCILFGDRFPFRYMTEDYGLTYYAAFIGCSAETEASFETIRFLSNKVDELNLKSVMTIEGSDQKIAQSIVDNTTDKNQSILTINSMQSVTMKDVEDGAQYLSIMEDNLEVLKEALK
ncbi:MAG: zinc ABC transporter substrate-binding protein [Lachnospiraceae bacterium]|jgi:zinc transport system substrate-binding protein|nr:zinc ABC transporter substrate-binding protein [Lachnospiraceae bacterium]